MEGFSHYEAHKIYPTDMFPPEHPMRNPRVHMYYIKGGFVISASPVLNGVSSFGIAEHTFGGGLPAEGMLDDPIVEHTFGGAPPPEGLLNDPRARNSVQHGRCKTHTSCQVGRRFGMAATTCTRSAIGS